MDKACRRYETVIENYRKGVYPQHERPSDDFIRAMSNSMEAWDEYLQRQKNKLLELRKEYRELKEEMNSSRQRLKESIAQYFERFM